MDAQLKRAAAFCERVGEWPPSLSYTPGFGWHIESAQIEVDAARYILEGWLRDKYKQIDIESMAFQKRWKAHVLGYGCFSADTLLAALLDAAEHIEKGGEQ